MPADPAAARADAMDADTVNRELSIAGIQAQHLTGPHRRASAKTCWRATATPASFPEAVRENEEVVPVNTVSTWVLPSGVTVGR